MNKEFRRDLAGMFSLMERMEKHATLNEAEGNKKYYMNEAYDPKGAKPYVELKSTGNGKYTLKIGGLHKFDTGYFASGCDRIENDPKNNGYICMVYDNFGTVDEIKAAIQTYLIDGGVFEGAAGQYDADSVANLADKDTWHFATAGRSNDEDVPEDIKKMFIDIQNKNITQLKKDLAILLNSNQYDDSLASKLGQTIINLERQYGNELSDNNKAAIIQQAARYGLQPGDPDYPTFVVAEKTWFEEFGRQVVPNPKYVYYIEANKARKISKKKALEKAMAQGLLPPGSTEKDLDGLSSQQKYKLFFNDNETNYGPSKAFNITDTVDLTGTDKFLNEMGLLNNITGELNDLAKQDKEEYEKQKEAALAATMDSEEYEAHKEEKMKEMEVRFLGRATAEVCNKLFNTNLSLNESAPLQSYVNLLKALTKKFANSLNIVKESSKDIIADVAAYQIAVHLKGYGAYELQQIAQRNNSLGPNGKQFEDPILSVVKQAEPLIKKQYNDLVKEFVEAHKNAQQAQTTTGDGDGNQDYSSVAETYFNKKYLV